MGFFFFFSHAAVNLEKITAIEMSIKGQQWLHERGIGEQIVQCVWICCLWMSVSGLGALGG